MSNPIPSHANVRIYNEIVAYMVQGSPSDWYVGITSDAETRLAEHGILRSDHSWIVRRCATSVDARNVEDALLRYGCVGGPGGGDATSVYVYAYLKRRGSRP
jgi:hypothetical protein